MTELNEIDAPSCAADTAGDPAAPPSSAPAPGMCRCGARGRMAERFDQLRRDGGEFGVGGMERAKRAALQADRVVHDWPYAAAGLAAATALMVGFLVGRR